MKEKDRMIAYQGCRIFLPMPVMVVVEDVGWWQGRDGSAYNQPFRNGLNRRHCLADYQALARFAERLSTQIVLGMVLCEWDRNNSLKSLPSATWMGTAWNNAENQGYWLDQAADFINRRPHLFQTALHGVGHEFWQDGVMARSEFHDACGRMRHPDIIIRHLAAFFDLMAQNHLCRRPVIFIPPALNHSFGNRTIQALLKGFGIDFVITRFSRARQYAAPEHPCLTWESDVVLLNRGKAPVPWHQVAAKPVWDGSRPILPLHWANLLHEDPACNFQVVDAWADLILRKVQGPDMVMVKDGADCFCQAGAHYLGRMALEKEAVAIDLGGLPDIPSLNGRFCIKIQGNHQGAWQCRGADIVSDTRAVDQIQTLVLRPERGAKTILLSLKV